MPTVRTNDIETYYERRGEGPPVVFVHGAIVDYSQWDPQLDALSDEYTTIAYDVRGHGRTGGSQRGRYSVDLFADDLDALLDALEIDEAVLCGLSTGGCIAQVYAARHPDRVAGLVLADTFAPEYLSVGERLQRSLALRATVPFVRLFGYERVERWMVRLQERISGEGVSGDYGNIERIRETGPKMATDEFAKVIGAVAGFHRTEVRFHAISAPTLVLYGEHEAPFMRRQAEHLATEIGGATLHAVPGAGHASNLDNPEFVTEAVRKLLAQAYPSEAVETAEVTEESGT
ncbi:alpha/beta hydrolase fold protein [Halosimplex carlsbadense 2-9-1]|uniref:Alpha/beta hydrolase fold protein n=1 Tax=Halosimplex carlsbadense 2-9-1 TaxID=797114 RepID=M0CK53_9EURY|nr:alpha/beta hydrolase [Halosimplex carlsbadense]ELZ22269.1 alpha/beta hydrolase fold protein [Halosimplex carlsbadense 2-9-1]